MKTLAEVSVEGTDDISLSKLLGGQIKDILGTVSKEFGDPVFQVHSIILEDGRTLHFGGEHDIAYLDPDEDILPQEQLELLYD